MADAQSGLTVDFESFKRQIDRFAKEYGVDMDFVMRDQMRLWILDLIKSMPWKNVTKTVEMRAIKSDINRLFVPLGKREVVKFFKESFSSEATSGNRAVLPPQIKFNFEGNQGEMRRWHDEHRNKSGSKQGRVSYKSHVMATIGPWRFVNEMYVPAADLNKYIKSRQAEAGKLKGGWLGGLRHYKGTVSQPWINAHATGRGWGGIDQHGTGTLFAVNPVPYASKFQGIVNYSARTRESDLRQFASKRIKALVARENKRKGGA